jgi:chromosome segregation ATPase
MAKDNASRPSNIMPG